MLLRNLRPLIVATTAAAGTAFYMQKNEALNATVEKKRLFSWGNNAFGRKFSRGTHSYSSFLYLTLYYSLFVSLSSS